MIKTTLNDNSWHSLMKKQSNRLQTTSEELHMMSWDDHSWVQWASQYGQYVIYGLAGIIVALLLIYRFGLGGDTSERDYINADREFRLFISTNTADPEAAQNAFMNLSVILEKHPELHAKYDGIIAQTLINRGDVGQAQTFANRAIDRTQAENNPYYTSYAQTSLLIEDRNYLAALSGAQELRKQLLAETNPHAYGDTLFAFNLLRIAILQQQLGLKDDERKTWQEWKEYLNGQKINESARQIFPQAFNQQVEHFKDGEISIKNYIQERGN